eukprot:4693442-Pleurochrysis_carterae.AAC.2
MGPFDASIKCTGVRTMTVSSTATTTATHTYDDESTKRRFESSMYYPFEERFNLDTKARTNTVDIIASLSNACWNGSFPNITKLIIEEPSY